MQSIAILINYIDEIINFNENIDSANFTKIQIKIYRMLQVLGTD